MKMLPIALLTMASVAQADQAWTFDCRFENETRARYTVSATGSSFEIGADGARTMVSAQVHDDVFILFSDGDNGIVVTSISRTDIWEEKALATMTLHKQTTWSPKVLGGGCSSK